MINDKIKNKVIYLFYNEEENSSPDIAKKVRLKTHQVDNILNKHFKEKYG